MDLSQRSRTLPPSQPTAGPLDSLADVGGRPVSQVPEILAPVGSPAMLEAALASRADAVYLGLDEGLNARAKAKGFDLASLPAIVAKVHRARARVYLTLNTLVFQSELEKVAALLAAIARAGVDAIIVQDPAVALLARRICPDLRVHASTQMTVSSAEGARFAASLGCVRMVVPRELSVEQIARLREQCELELEVFVHGALCMAWSGQCLSSEAWDQRSANRGQCNQACRMPYDLVVDGQSVELGDVRYLLSPKDLAAFRAVPRLLAIGVGALKIEGRYKPPAYVAVNVRAFREWRDAVVRGLEIDDLRQVEQAQNHSALIYSRGFSDGHLGGSDHQNLVEGRFPKHRGLYLGRVSKRVGSRIWVTPQERAVGPGLRKGVFHLPVFGGSSEASSGLVPPPIAVHAGMGMVFDLGQPEDPQEPGGPVFGAHQEQVDWVIDFGHLGRHLDRVSPGARAWVSSDGPSQALVERQIAQADLGGRWPCDLRVGGRLGEPLWVRAQAGPYHARAASKIPLQTASKNGLDATTVREKIGSFGGTPLALRELVCDELESGLFVPVSQLKDLRRAVVEELCAAIDLEPSRRHLPIVEPAKTVTAALDEAALAVAPVRCSEPVQLVALCRNLAQLQACLQLGLREIELDWMEFVGLRQAVELAKRGGARVVVATVRVQKPGEEGYDRRIAELQPDGVLVRHWGALMHFAQANAQKANTSALALHGDFSLNVTNALTAQHLLGLGLHTLTASHDLDFIQLGHLLDRVTPAKIAVTVHHHMPLFHNDHCVYARHLSQGRDFRTCGRPCDHHHIALRDHAGCEHPIVVDVECRNTLFNGRAQSALSWLEELRARGVRRLRIEFVREDQAAALKVMRTYQDLIAQRIDRSQALRDLDAVEQFGVSRVTMATL